MATRALVPVQYPVDRQVGRSRGGSWSGLLNGDDGGALSLPNFTDRTVQIFGTFGTGGTISIQGSLDGTNWVILTDPQGNAITKTAAAIESISEATPYIRPIVTAGDGTTSLSVLLFGTQGSYDNG
jgi:hypothetical protein